MPTTTGWIFYVSNLVIVSGYLAAAIAITRRKALAANMSWRAWAAGIAFFVLCGFTHVELAIHAWTGEAITARGDEGLEFHVWFHMLLQAPAIWLFLLAMAGEGRAPLEGSATDARHTSHQSGEQ